MSLSMWLLIVAAVTFSYFGIFWYGYTYGKEDGRKGNS